MASVRAAAGAEAAARAPRRPPSHRLDTNGLPASAGSRSTCRYQPRSTLPLAACLWAQEQGRLRPFKHALYEAFFCEGEDIATDAEIARAAERAGLDPQGAVRAAYLPELGSRLQEIREQADAAGIGGVPSMLASDGRSHWGMGGVERLLTGEPLVPRPA